MSNRLNLRNPEGYDELDASVGALIKQSKDPEKYPLINFDRAEAGHYCVVHRFLKSGSRRNLDKYASRRRAVEAGERALEDAGEIGPPYSIVGVRSVYRLADLDAWINSKMKPKTLKPKPTRAGRRKTPAPRSIENSSAA